MNSPAPRSRHVLALLALAALFTPPARAVTTTWTRAAGTSFWATNANWSASQPTGAVDALFPSPIPGNAPVIVFSAAEVAASLTFDAPYTLDASASPTSSLSLGGTGAVTVNGSVTATIDVNLSGITGLTKQGSGTLELRRGSTFTGGVTISSGKLSIGADNHLGPVPNAVTLNGGTLSIRSTLSTSRNLTFSIFGGAVDVAPDAIFTLNSPITANQNTLLKTGAGTWILNNASARTASATIHAGTVRLNNAAGLGSGPIILRDGGTLEIPDATHVVNGLFLQHNGAIRSAGGFAATGGTCFVSADAGPVFLDGGPTPADTLRIGNLAPNAYTGGAGTTTVVTGAGKVMMFLDNDYAGGWQVDSGTLTYFNPAALGTATSAIVVNAGTFEVGGPFNRAINLNHGATLATFVGTTTSAPVTVAPASAVTLALRGDVFPDIPDIPDVLGDSPNDLTGGTNSFITVTGSGPLGPTLHLEHANDYAGAWSIGSFAKVRISNPTALGTATTAISLANGATPNGGTLELANVTLARAVNMLNGTTLRGTGPSAALAAPLTFNLFGTATLDAPAADDTLLLTGPLTTSGGALHKSGAGTVRITGPQTHATGATLNVNAGTLDLFSPAGDATTRNLSVNLNAGTLRMNQTQHLKALTVADGARATLDGPGAAVLQTNALTTAGTGQLDLTNDRLIVVDGPFTNIANKISTGFNAGAWNGPGIITTAATPNTGLGVARAGDVGLANSTFAGVPVAANDVLVRLTLLGDANLDATVDFEDLVRLAQNYDTTGKRWYQGDFTYDTTVDFNDLVKLAQNYNQSLPTTPIPGAPTQFHADLQIAFATVPEPTTFLPTLTLATSAFVLRPRKRPHLRIIVLNISTDGAPPSS